MNKNACEVIRFFLRDLYFSQIIIIQLVICFTVCMFSNSFRHYFTVGTNKFEKKYITQKYYQLVDRFEDEESGFIDSENTLSKLMLFYDRLTSTDKFSFLEVYKQPVYIKDFEGPGQMFDGYEFDSIQKNGDFSFLKAVWCGRTFYDIYDIKLCEGKWFRETDFSYSRDDTVPVVLGYNYKDLYKTGDIIDSIIVNGNSDGNKLEVIGFTAENTAVAYNSEFINLDNYIILPFNHVRSIPSNDIERKKAVYNLMMITNGVVVSNDNAETVQTYIKEICSEIRIEPSYVIVGSKNQQAKYIHTDIKECNNLLRLISIVLIVFACGIMTIFLIISIKQNIKYFSILLISGFDYLDLFKIILGQSLIYQIESLFFSVCISIILCNRLDVPFKLSSLIIILIISALVSVVSSITAYISFTKYDISEHLRKR